ncbi:MAG: serine hydrolase [Candidatus Saccharimonadales bacterium]
MNKKHTVVLVIVGICLVIVGVVVGKFFVGDTKSTASNTDYPLLAKRLFVENPNDTRINFSPLRKQLNQYFTDNNLKGSLYFEYLPTGTSIRVNGDERYRAASLLKLPVAMELYKASELGKVDLDSTVTLKKEWLNDGYGTLYDKGEGYQLSLRDAARILLEESDNTALRAILDATDGKLETTDLALGSLDIEFTLNKDTSIDLGTRSYSSFFKCLYFACYNNKADSQEILNYLSNSTFNNRLQAGIPDDSVTVAHKIGVFNTQVQSDCGIVYYDNGNYLVCVMLMGEDNETTNNQFKNISNVIYRFVSDNKQ